jgi:hypothetical protein
MHILDAVELGNIFSFEKKAGLFLCKTTRDYVCRYLPTYVHFDVVFHNTEWQIIDRHIAELSNNVTF